MSTIPSTRQRLLDDLARRQALTEVFATADEDLTRELRSELLGLLFPLVYTCQTKRLERQRGHHRCAAGVHLMAADCHDRYVDDVLSVERYVLAFCNEPVQNLEGWIASRISKATIDGHRRRRGEMGAMQRPRIPHWLHVALGHDSWLILLALHILEWVGIPTTAGYEIWPLDAWSCEREQHPQGRLRTSSIDDDVRLVLAITRRERPRWYQTYVERPLGHKPIPVSPVPPEEQVHFLPQPSDPQDARLIEAATTLLEALPAHATPAADTLEELLDHLRGQGCRTSRCDDRRRAIATTVAS